MFQKEIAKIMEGIDNKKLPRQYYSMVKYNGGAHKQTDTRFQQTLQIWPEIKQT